MLLWASGWVLAGVAAILMDQWQHRRCPPVVRRLPHIIKGLYILAAPFTFILSLALFFTGEKPDGGAGKTPD